MAQRVCPWWMGYFLVSPVRRLESGSPEKLLAPYVKEGMTVLEPGPGMGFFTLPMARMVGPWGRIVVADIQPKMLEGLRRRAAKAGLLRNIQIRLVKPDSLGLDDLIASVDFVMAFAVVHELPSTERFFRESAKALKVGGKMLLAEPAGHVTPAEFAEEIDAARRCGLTEEERPAVRRSLAAVLVKKTG